MNLSKKLDYAQYAGKFQILDTMQGLQVYIAANNLLVLRGYKMTAPIVLSNIDEGLMCHSQAKIICRQSYVQPDGGFHYLHRSTPGEPPHPVITLFRIVNEPKTLMYEYLRHWKYLGHLDLLECPHCRQTLPDPILSCRFEWLADDQRNWLAECPTCRGWSIVTG